MARAACNAGFHALTTEFITCLIVKRFQEKPALIYKFLKRDKGL